MSTTHHQVVGKCNNSAACEFKDENTFRRETLFFSGKVVSVLAGLGFGLQKLSTKSAQDCSESSICTSKGLKKTDGAGELFEDEVGKRCTGLLRERDLQFKMLKNWRPRASEHFWKMRSATCARDCSESSVSHKNCNKTGTFRAAPKSPHCRSSYAGLQLAVTKRIGRAARSKAWVMLRRSWQAGLQLDAAKRSVTAARREELGCRSYKRASWEAVQSTSSPDKWLLREEVAERRDASAKGSLSEEVAIAQQRKVHRFIHPSIHPFIHPSIPSFIGSFIDYGFTESPIHWVMGSLNRSIDSSVPLIHWVIADRLAASFVHWFAESFIHRLTKSYIDSHDSHDSLIHWFTEPSIHCIHWFIRSLIHWFDSFIGSLIHCFTGCLIHWVIAALIPWLSDSLIHWFINSLVHWFIHSVVHGWILSCHFIGILSNHSLIVSQKLSYRPLISYWHVVFSKLSPQRGPGTTWCDIIWYHIPLPIRKLPVENGDEFLIDITLCSPSCLGMTWCSAHLARVQLRQEIKTVLLAS